MINFLYKSSSKSFYTVTYILPKSSNNTLGYKTKSKISLLISISHLKILMAFCYFSWFMTWARIYGALCSILSISASSLSSNRTLPEEEKKFSKAFSMNSYLLRIDIYIIIFNWMKSNWKLLTILKTRLFSRSSYLFWILSENFKWLSI